MLNAAVDGSFPYQKLPDTITLTGPFSRTTPHYRHRDRERGWADAGQMRRYRLGPAHDQWRNQQPRLKHWTGTELRGNSLAVRL
jgi:hypothetical protein